MYNTEEEEKSIKAIKEHLGKTVDVLNPRDYDEDPDFAYLKKRKGLSVCFRLIDQTDCLVFSRFYLSKKFKNYVLEYVQHADEYSHFRNRLKENLKDVPARLQRLITEKTSLVTPGVAKEVNYALMMKKDVYELLPRKLRAWNKKLQSDFEGPSDPLYGTFSLMLKTWRDGKYRRLFPHFWWLE
jgi:hypothetical protein